MKAGTVLDHFEIVEPLGRGGFGEVWKARDLRLNRFVAIKKLPDDLIADAAVRERLRREALAASSLTHANICTIYDFVSIDGEYLLVMEYVDGKTIHDLLRDGTLPAAKAVAIAVQIAEALEEAHRRGILHRDIKSNNVMISASGQVKVLDFGLAKQVQIPDDRTDGATDMRLTREGTAVGTLQYMSPEQLLGKPLDARTDVFSLGVVTYEMLTGRLPFAGSSAAAISDAILHSDPAPLPMARELQDIVRKSLAKEPDRRYASAADFAAALRAAVAPGRTGKKRVLLAAAIVAIVLIVAAVAGYGRWKRWSREKWVTNTAVPQIQSMLRRDDYAGAFRLTKHAEGIVPGHPELAKLWSESSFEASFRSTPPSADVYWARYADRDDRLQLLGRTPLAHVRFPRGLFYRVHIVKSGYAPAERLFPYFGLGGRVTDLPVTLLRADAVPSGMIEVPAKEIFLSIPGLDHLPSVEMPAYFLDQDEVSNADYKQFVDADGYEKKEYWKQPLVRDGKTIGWESAMAEFVDTTGHAGPSTWELGSYPQGKGSHPVSGVSWYEASAYAAFARKRLPTIYHWNGAAMTPASVNIAPASNFSGHGTEPVGTRRGLANYGTYDMAGNVKEWCSNEAEPGKRYILGGSFNEPSYMFIDQDAQPAWSRSPSFGFRCVRSPAPVPAAAEKAVFIQVRDYSKERPVTDQLFRAYLSAYEYDKTPLEAQLVSRDTSSADWIEEKIVMKAAYGGERVIVYVYLPRNARPPLQPVIFFPGSGAIHLDRFTGPDLTNDYLARSGRALVMPIFKGTYERRDAFKSDYPEHTTFYRDHVISWSKDIGRTIDYLETRQDMDVGKLSFVGLSWGGAMGPIMLAVEPRMKTAVLIVGGFDFQRAFPEVDQINFVPRVKQPTLMLNARYDHFFPVETSQVPMFRLLGTAERDKRRIVYESGHGLPRTEMIKETVAWLNRYAGAPRR